MNCVHISEKSLETESRKNSNADKAISIFSSCNIWTRFSRFLWRSWCFSRHSSSSSFFVSTNEWVCWLRRFATAGRTSVVLESSCLWYEKYQHRNTQVPNQPLTRNSKLQIILSYTCFFHIHLVSHVQSMSTATKAFVSSVPSSLVPVS